MSISQTDLNIQAMFSNISKIARAAIDKAISQNAGAISHA